MKTYKIKIILEKDCFESVADECDRIEAILEKDERCVSYLIDWTEGGASNSDGISTLWTQAFDKDGEEIEDYNQEIEDDLKEMLFALKGEIKMTYLEKLEESVLESEYRYFKCLYGEDYAKH